MADRMDVAKKMPKKKPSVKSRLNYLRGQLNKERISYGELAELQKHKKHLYNDPQLAEAAGIPESEFMKHQKRK